jgi:hypothetical protein
MAKPGIDQLLIASVLDPLLLERLRQSPQDVLDDYELSDEEREILTAPDERFIDLLGRVIRDAAVTAPVPAAGNAGSVSGHARTGSAAEGSVLLQESRLVLRLVPYVQRVPSSAGGDQPPVLVNYIGHLDPLPAGVGVDSLPPVPAASVPGQALTPLMLVVVVRPLVTGDGENRRVSFTLHTELPTDPAPAAADRPANIDEEPSPWRHDTTSDNVLEKARRVHAAGADERFPRLLDLIDAMLQPVTGQEGPP